jgi:hypothetical protein
VAEVNVLAWAWERGRLARFFIKCGRDARTPSVPKAWLGRRSQSYERRHLVITLIGALAAALLMLAAAATDDEDEAELSDELVEGE